MEIKIFRDDQEKIIFSFNNKNYEFVYDSFDELIDAVYNNDLEITVNNESEFDEYKQLLLSIIEESRKEEYVKEINDSIKAKKSLEEFDSEILNKDDQSTD